MIDPNEYEQRAMQAAADVAGEFIESTGQTDMSAWPLEQWQSFIATVCGGYVDNLAKQQADIFAAMNRATVQG